VSIAHLPFSIGLTFGRWRRLRRFGSDQAAPGETGMESAELVVRLRSFAVRTLKLCDALPRSPGARTIANQLAASSTSVGANYRSACCGRSRAEFIARLGICEEEADESEWWLELITAAGYMRASRVEALRQEANELTRILAASRKTAKAGARRERSAPVDSSPRSIGRWEMANGKSENH
jgi:four helix bundle protein